MTNYKVNAQTLLEPVQFFASPNFNDRPEKIEISLLVIHNISLPPQQFTDDYVKAFFLNQLDSQAHPYFETIKDKKVSSHLFIRRYGEVLQFVPFNKRAWHAGVSSFQGVADCNNFSIGIELEGADDIPYTSMQYQELIAITQCLQHYYPAIKKGRIVGHNDIAPERKTDPGKAFDWHYYLEQL